MYKDFYGYTPANLLQVIADACEQDWGNLPHVVELSTSELGSCTVPGIDLVSYGDYHGSDLDAANTRALIAEFGDVFYRSEGAHGAVSLALAAAPGVSPFARSLDAAESVDDWVLLACLASIMTRLVDYPLISEEVHAEYINELIDQAWDSWLRSDLLSELADLTGNEDLHFDPPETLVDSIREAYLGFEENEWVAESATSVVNHRHEDAVRHVLATVFGGNPA